MMAHREPTQVELEAAHWLVVLDTPPVRRLDIEAFQNWLAAHPAHKRAYEAVSATSDKIDALLAREPELAPSLAPRRRLNRRFIAVGAVAAAAALAAPFILPVTPFRGAPGEVYVTESGQARVVNLSDGSSIEMAPGAHIRVSMEADKRRVRFEEGVALFNVSHDPVRPFIVATRFGDIRVTGTSFVVRVGSDAALTTVLSGQVEASRRALLSPRESVSARADQEIVLDGGALTVAALSRDVVDRRLVWRDRMVALDGQTLREAAAEVTRFSGVRFAFADAEAARLRLGGYVAGDDVEAFLDLLETNMGVVAERGADGVIVLRSDASD